MTKAIETDVWVKDPEKPHFLILERTKTISEVYKELSEILKEEDVYNELDYFHSGPCFTDEKNKPFPKYHWISCFAVTGGSEGHYIHIETVNGDIREHLYTGKTFLGLEHALKVANICTRAFYQ